VTDPFGLAVVTGSVGAVHTMTRTGLSPRLCTHSPEPFVEIHPADAKAAKLADGGTAKITTPYGSSILKVIFANGQRRGSCEAARTFAQVS
jgi:anaerobic selenocysteine-containing dehydrogenase